MSSSIVRYEVAYVADVKANKNIYWIEEVTLENNREKKSRISGIEFASAQDAQEWIDNKARK